MEMGIQSVTALNNNSQMGQITTGILVQYSKPIAADSVDIGTYKVSGRKILAANVKNTHMGKEGNFVEISLDAKDKRAMTRKMVGFGPGTRTRVTGAQIKLRQVKAVTARDGQLFKGTFKNYVNTSEISPIVDSFNQYAYETPDGKQLKYNLYIPQNVKTEKLPLVVFMHDSSVCSESVKAPLLQGMGALVWANEEEQRKRPCCVLAPLYEEKTAFDDFTVTWQCEATAKLIRELVHSYNLDESRIYGTGQSMGCMMLYDLALKISVEFLVEFLPCKSGMQLFAKAPFNE